MRTHNLGDVFQPNMHISCFNSMRVNNLKDIFQPNMHIPCSDFMRDRKHAPPQLCNLFCLQSHDPLGLSLEPQFLHDKLSLDFQVVQHPQHLLYQ